jgi:tRNA pseudouridine55 synthase
VAREPKLVRVERFALRKYDPPRLEIEVECSGGTYVRVLAADLGERLGCGAHLADLRRTRSGPFTIDQASSPDTLRVEAESGEIERRLVSPLEALGLPALRLDPHEVAQIAQGSEIAAEGAPDVPGTRMVAHDDERRVVAILELRPGRRLRPLRVLEPFAGRR